MPVVNFPRFIKKRVAVARARKALPDMDVDLSQKAQKCEEIRQEMSESGRMGNSSRGGIGNSSRRGQGARRRQREARLAKEKEEEELKKKKESACRVSVVKEEEEEEQRKSSKDQPAVESAENEESEEGPSTETETDTAKTEVEGEGDVPTPPVEEAPAPPPEPPKEPASKTLGVSVYHLKHVFVEEANLPKEWTINEIEDLTRAEQGVIRMNSGDIVCPVDGKMGAAYVHCLDGEDDVGEATHFLSYSWRCSIGDIISTLYDYCETNDLSTNRTYIWLDCLCVNQHRVAERYAAANENKDDNNNKPTVQDFQTMFAEQILGVAKREGGRFLALMDPPIEAPTYLTRLWCLYELYYAKTHGCPVDIVMPPKEKQALVDDVIGEHGGMDGLFKALGSTKIQNTSTSFPEDKEILLQLIEQEEGGTEAVNKQLIEVLRDWMKSNLLDVIHQQTTTDDLNYAALCSNVGLLLWDNQECDAALELLRKSAAIQEKLWGEDYPDTAITYNNIGLVLKDKGDYEEALKLFRKCLAIDEAAYGKDDPGTADSYSNIACVLLDKGDYDDALAEYKKCLAIQEATLGKDHYDTATTYKSVGTVLEAKGEHDAALEMYQKCLNIQFATLGNDHPSTKSCLEAIKSLKEIMGSTEST